MERSDWLVFGRDFIVRTITMETVRFVFNNNNNSNRVLCLQCAKIICLRYGNFFSLQGAFTFCLRCGDLFCLQCADSFSLQSGIVFYVTERKENELYLSSSRSRTTCFHTTTFLQNLVLR